MKPKGLSGSFNCAIEGILWAVGTQRHMRYHLLVALVLLLVALFFHVNALEFILLVFGAVLVFFAELVNTALEVVVDMVSPEYHPMARRAKDVAAGAVLMSCVGAAVLGYLALSAYFFPPPGEGLPLLARPPGHGRPLHGGMPSGHAAFSFSVATAIVLSRGGTILSLLTLALAVLVSQSRIHLRIHALNEVVASALLGVGTTAIIYICFG
jgi:diacylglycerol kinase (ATP)